MTGINKYLDKLKSNKAKISRLSGISTSRINAISNNEDAKPYAEELYKIIHIANRQAGLSEESFNQAIDEIFPNRKKIDLLAEFRNLSPEGQFFKKYTQKQSDIEQKLGIANGKISKYFGDRTKRALAIEIIDFADGMGLDVLGVFKEIYGRFDEIESISLPNPTVLNGRTDKIYQYIEAYNQFDVPNMIVNMSDTIIFLNMENHKTTIRLEGIDEFKKQAVEAVSYFTHRKQTILSMTHKANSAEILVDYDAIVAMDFPNGTKKGDQIKLKGKSIFEFSQDGKIEKLTDIS